MIVSKKSARTSRRLKSRKILITVTVVLLLWIVVAWFSARWLIVSVPLNRADAILVLSGSQAYRERAEYAALLYRSGVAPVVILTNDGERASWSNVEQRNPYYHELAAAQLESRGVPPSAIKLLPGFVHSTVDEAVAARGFADGTGIKTLLVVTSPHHSRRAFWTFENELTGKQLQVGIQSPELSKGLSFFWWVRPYGWKTVGAEYIKMVYYWISLRS